MLVVARNHRSGAERRVTSWLESWTGRHKIPGIALTNCYVARQEVDLVLVTPFTTVVGEIKGLDPAITGGVLTCSPNSPWRVAGYDGDPVTVRKRDDTPYDQARAGAIALNQVAAETGGGGFVTGLVLVVPPRNSTVQLVQSSPPPQGCDALLCHDQNPLRAWFHRAHHKSCAIWTAEQVHALVEALDFDDRISLTALVEEGFPTHPDQPRATVPPVVEPSTPPPPIPATAPGRSAGSPTPPGTGHQPFSSADPPNPANAPGAPPPPAATPTRSAETPTPPDTRPVPAKPQSSPAAPDPAYPAHAAAAAATQIDAAPPLPTSRPPHHTASAPAAPPTPADEFGTESPPTESPPTGPAPPNNPSTPPPPSIPPGPAHLSGTSAPAPPSHPGSETAPHALLTQEPNAPVDGADTGPPPTPSDRVHPFRQPAADRDDDASATDPTAEQRRRGWSQTAAAFAAIAVLGTGLWLVGQARGSAGGTEPTTGNTPVLSVVEQPPAAVPHAPASAPPAPAQTSISNCYPFQPGC